MGWKDSPALEETAEQARPAWASAPAVEEKKSGRILNAAKQIVNADIDAIKGTVRGTEKAFKIPFQLAGMASDFASDVGRNAKILGGRIIERGVAKFAPEFYQKKVDEARSIQPELRELRGPMLSVSNFMRDKSDKIEAAAYTGLEDPDKSLSR